MNITEIFERGKAVVSLEIFPPKKDEDLPSVYGTVDALSKYKPDFVSVTYGAAGSGEKNKTADIAAWITAHHGITALAHLTCADMTEKELETNIVALKGKSLDNVLALRGDRVGTGGAFAYAKDLIARLKPAGFCVGAAAYPEGHIACDTLEDEVRFVRLKQDAGADFFITQLFFDNDIFYRFLDKVRSSGVTAPFSAGIMPIMSKAQISRMIFMCGASLPSRVVRLLNRYGDEGDSLVCAGIDYALAQIRDLMSHGVDGIHLYTMNKPVVAQSILGSMEGR